MPKGKEYLKLKSKTELENGEFFFLVSFPPQAVLICRSPIHSFNKYTPGTENTNGSKTIMIPFLKNPNHSLFIEMVHILILPHTNIIINNF